MSLLKGDEGGENSKLAKKKKNAVVAQGHSMEAQSYFTHTNQIN